MPATAINTPSGPSLRGEAAGAYRGHSVQEGRRFFRFSLILPIMALICVALARGIWPPVIYIADGLIGLWAAFALFILQFFRDPDPVGEYAEGAFVAPAWGRVQVVDEFKETDWIQGPSRRVSIFLSFFDVHVQNAPVSGTIGLIKHRRGRLLSTTNPKCSLENESLLIGFQSPAAERTALRLIAGPIARRTLPFVKHSEPVSKGQRISLIRFGSRVDIFLPMTAKVLVRPGEKVKGGHTIIATSC